MHTALDNVFDQLKLEEDSTFHPGRALNTPTALKRGTSMWLPKREDIFIQVDKFRGHAHKKYCGWSSATSAFDNARCPSRKNLLYIYSRGKDTTIYADQHQVSTAARRGLADSSFHKVEVTSGNYSQQNENGMVAHVPSMPTRRVDIRVVPIQRECTLVPPPPAPEDEWVDMQAVDEPPADSRPPQKRKWTTIFDIGWQTITMSTCACSLLVRGSWARNHPTPVVSRQATGAATASALRCSAVNTCLRDIDFIPFVALRPGMAPSLTTGTYASSACGCSLVTPTTDDALTLTQGGRNLCGSQSHWERLLSHGWYPATPDNPQSAITIAALKLFHGISLQGKTTAYHFFNALAKLLTIQAATCSNLSTSWRFGSYTNGVTFVLSSTWAWATIPTTVQQKRAMGSLPSTAWHALRLGRIFPKGGRSTGGIERKKISSWLADPSIQDGWAYFTCSGPYMEFVEMLGEQKEMSTCTGLAALDHANTKYAQGYAANGCGMITCGHHEVVCKNGVGDLQAGENLPITSSNLSSPSYISWAASSSAKISFRCSTPWALHKPTWKGSRGFGPPDTLDDFWHYWNWNKAVGMGKTLRTCLLEARKELAWQEEGLEEFTAAQEAEAPAWKQMVDDFEAGYLGLCQSVFLANTLFSSLQGPTLCQLAADLLAKRHPTSKELMDFITRHTRVSHQIKKLQLMQCIYSPAVDPVEPVESERVLLFLPSSLSPAQAAPLLSVSGLTLAEVRLCDGQCSESLEAIRHGLTIKKHLQTYKTLLPPAPEHVFKNACRQSAAEDRPRCPYLSAGTHGVPGTRPRCRPCSWCALEKRDLQLPKDEEEAKRRKQCAMKGKRKEVAQVNENGEVRGVPGMGEKNRLISWIWYGAGNTEGVVGEVIHKNVRVEWSKTYTWVKRWQEETHLLQEEMVQCLLTLEWQAALWDERAVSMHYNGWIQYSAVHLQGSHPLRTGMGTGTGPVAQVIEPGEGRGRAVESEEGEEEEEEEEEEEGAGGKGVGGEDAERHRAEMDKLLAIQTTFLRQYNKV
ncbi:hypothetical protein DFH08DRAFT_802181 [Mycena albidolilacea]|uniref:CxC2-like cysteine cluster KDZ transposase-associated domain-containing protein n=1 Tax=Mycena albidolilacea TaxID=1033008 RepID=A0AAD7F0P8_9AGAR|nr:hypothetical protein DFH08DRAFT_802181 [Mycena albidolilacea]